MAQFHAPGTAWQMANADGRSVLIDQAMEMLGVSRRTVYYWIRQGRLQTIRTRGGSQRVLVASMPRLGLSMAPAASRQHSSGILGSLGA